MKFDGVIGFDWDEGNIDKNFIKHHVYDTECEEVFFNFPLIVAEDKNHSSREKRYYALGKTHQNRLLFISFTIRVQKIRIISARDMTDGESKKYVQRYSHLQE